MENTLIAFSQKRDQFLMFEPNAKIQSAPNKCYYEIADKLVARSKPLSASNNYGQLCPWNEKLLLVKGSVDGNIYAVDMREEKDVFGFKVVQLLEGRGEKPIVIDDERERESPRLLEKIL
ncbi:hypothetical protein FGO68_gene1151 [Halteria grandinella]|uniref:Uncharacterized protein n=1 Tax=Halteria grandinella TaxID=5974 RepID=A0A8J8NAA4_HALGN|nr:hypothetical protein FGO68_gene1151 [Halteria grandinella]